jgi:hypothetical protein
MHPTLIRREGVGGYMEPGVNRSAMWKDRGCLIGRRLEADLTLLGVFRGRF